MHPLDTCFRAARSVLSAFMGSVLAMCATVSAQTSLSSNDFTGDGIADTVVAVEGFDSTTPRSGSVSIGISPTGQTLLSISGPGVNDRFARTAGGWRIAATGAPDLVVTAPALNGAGANSSGAVFVFLVPAGQLRYSITAQSNHRFGDRAAVISDQNADGFGELLVEGAELINGQWFYRTYLHSGASGALLAKYDVVIDSIVRFAGSGGRAYAQADLNNNGFVDQEDLLDIAGGVGEVAGPGDARDLDGSGEIDSIDVFEAVSAMLRGDTTIVASGALIQSYSDWTAAQDRWNVLNGSSALASSLTNVDTGGGVGGTPGLFPCDPNSIGEVNPNCVAQLQGCPSRPISIGEQFVLGSGVYNGPGSSCSIEVVDDGSPASVVETAPGYFQAVAAGCTTVRLICTTGGGQTCCQACEICVAAGPTCPTPLLWTGCPESFEAISTVGDVVLRTYLQNYQNPVSVEWAIELLGAGMDVCQIPDDPGQPGDPNAACANWTCLGCPSGQELRLANHPHFAAILQQLIAISNTEDSRTLCVRFRTTETILTASGTANCVLCGTCPIQVGLKDSDGDGLIDVIEPGYNADPLLPDTDDDGFCDGDEVRAGSLPNLASSVPTVGRQDVDLDGLPDGEDIRAKKLYNPEDGRPEVFDNDFDGVPDPSELELGLNPLTEFTAGQGAPDLLSAAWAQSDFDQDRLADKYELRLGLDPRVRDMDGDGIADGIEVRTGTNPTTSHRHESADFDGDGLSDYEELTFYFSDPSSRDSDRDGLSDAFEVRAGLDPTRAYSRARTINGQSFPGVADRDADLDYDGLSNHAESRFGTDPLLHDTDGDGTSDGEEVGVGGQGGGTGGDPLDPSDGGNGDSENYCWIMITVGGHWPGMCNNGANNQSLWNTGDVRTIEGSIGGGINDQKHPHTWTVTIGSGSGGGSSGGGGGGSLLPISTGPNGEREIAFRRFRRGACITVTIGDGTRVNDGGAINGLFVGMLPVDMTQPGAPACGDSCAVGCCNTHTDNYDDTTTVFNETLLGNHCGSNTSPAGHTATVCLSEVDIDVDSDNSGGFYAGPDEDEDEDLDRPENVSLGGMKLLLVNRFDSDNDGLLDFADGFNFDETPDTDDDTSGCSFTPVSMQVGGFTAEQRDSLTVTFECDRFSPLSALQGESIEWAGVDGSTQVQHLRAVTTGSIRLWKTQGDVPRGPADLIEQGVEYTLADFPTLDSTGRGAVFVEAVTGDPTPVTIRMRVKVDGQPVCAMPTIRVLVVDPLAPPQVATIAGYGEVLTSSNGGIVHGTAAKDFIIGSSGIDQIFAHGGDDIIIPLGGSDLISTGPGRDLVFSWRGSKLLLIDPQMDVVSYVGGHILANASLTNVQTHPAENTPEPQSVNFTAPGATFNAEDVLSAYRWAFGVNDPFLQAFLLESNAGEIHVVASLQPPIPAEFTPSNWDMDRHVSQIADETQPHLLESPARRYVFKCEYSRHDPMSAALALRNAIVSDMRIRDFEELLFASLSLAQRTDAVEVDKVYSSWNEMRQAQLQHVITLTKMTVEIYISLWYTLAGPTGEVIDAVLSARETASSIAAISKAGFELIASLPGKIETAIRDTDGGFIDDLDSLPPAPIVAPPDDGGVDDPTDPQPQSAAAIFARLRLNHGADAIFKTWDVARNCDVARILIGQNLFAKVGFVCRKGMDARPLFRADGTPVMILGKAQRTGDSLELHARTIGTLAKELAETGRLADVPDMPVRSYLYISQNRSVRTCVANADTGARFDNISTKKPDLLGVWLDPQTNKIGVDMFEVPSGAQAESQLVAALEQAWDSLPPSLRQYNAGSRNGILRVIPKMADQDPRLLLLSGLP